MVTGLALLVDRLADPPKYTPHSFAWALALPVTLKVPLAWTVAELPTSTALLLLVEPLAKVPVSATLPAAALTVLAPTYTPCATPPGPPPPVPVMAMLPPDVASTLLFCCIATPSDKPDKPLVPFRMMEPAALRSVGPSR